MERFLRTLLELSLAGSLLAAALTVLRPLLRGRVSRRASYYIWLLVLLRLCVPLGFNLPVPVPAEASAPVPPAAVQPAPVSPPDLSGPAPEPDAPDVPPEAQPPQAIEAIAPGQPVITPGQEGQLSIAPRASSALHPLRDPAFWALMWWLGALAGIGWFALGYLRVYARVRHSAAAASPEAQAVLRELDPKSRVRLAESPAVSTPLLLGVIHPLVALPAGVTDPDRLRDILSHELTHVRRKDLLVKWFAAVATSFHWFNPVMLLVRREIGRCCELACDEAVMKGLTAPERRRYGETLLALAAHAPKGLGSLAVTLCEEKKQLKERLYCIVKYKKSGPMVIFLSLILTAAVGACAMVNGVKPVTPNEPDPPPEEAPKDEDTEPPALYELDSGLTLAIPDSIADRLVVKPGGGDEYWDDLVSVYEKQSYDDNLTDYGSEGGGFLFGITRFTPERYEENYIGGDGSGLTPFAVDDTYYYMHTFATDVQFYRSGITNYADVDFTPWQELEDRVGGILDDFVTRNGLQPYSSLNRHAEVLYQNITRETSPDSRDYDFTARMEHNGKTDEFHITGENGYNVAFVGNYLTLSYVWQEAEESEWLDLADPGTILTLTGADGETSIQCRSGDDMAALTSNGETRYAHVWDPETPENPDPHLRYSLFSFLMTIPDDAFNNQVWDGTADGSLSPADAAALLAEQVAENYRNTPDWLDWKPLDFQVESAYVFDVYNGEDFPNFCFGGGFCVRLDDPNYMQWQAGAGLDDPITEGPFAGYYRWGREIIVTKNAGGDWYIADCGTGGYSVEFPDWSWSSGVENSLNNAALEDLADLFFLTEGVTHEYRLPSYICERPAEELAGLNDLLDRHTRQEAQDLCRALAAYLNAGFGESNHNALSSLEDLNALLSPAYQAYTADMPPYGEG